MYDMLRPMEAYLTYTPAFCPGLPGSDSRRLPIPSAALFANSVRPHLLVGSGHLELMTSGRRCRSIVAAQRSSGLGLPGRSPL